MATIAKPRTPIKDVKDDFFDQQPTGKNTRAEKDNVRKQNRSGAPGVGAGNASEVINNDSIRNAGQYSGGEDERQEVINEGVTTDEPATTGVGDKPDSAAGEIGGGGYKESISLLEREEQKRRAAFSELKRKSINQGAEELLSCLEPSYANEYRIASMEYGVKDIGIYILGILNRLAKEVDYNNPDFEVEWEQGVVGYTDTLHCNYCGKEIISPTKLKQKFCSNLCAKYYREQGNTGIIYPDEGGADENDSVEEQERRAYEAEQKRLGVIDV